MGLLEPGEADSVAIGAHAGVCDAGDVRLLGTAREGGAHGAQGAEAERVVRTDRCGTQPRPATCDSAVGAVSLALSVTRRTVSSGGACRVSWEELRGLFLRWGGYAVIAVQRLGRPPVPPVALTTTASASTGGLIPAAPTTAAAS